MPEVGLASTALIRSIYRSIAFCQTFDKRAMRMIDKYVMWSGKTPHMLQRVKLQKIKEINIIILMFFLIFYSLWTSVTFDTIIREDPSKKFWKENNSNFYMTPRTQNINFEQCDGLSQITSPILNTLKNTNTLLHPNSCSDVMNIAVFVSECGICIQLQLITQVWTWKGDSRHAYKLQHTHRKGLCFYVTSLQKFVTNQVYI